MFSGILILLVVVVFECVSFIRDFYLSSCSNNKQVECVYEIVSKSNRPNKHIE